MIAALADAGALLGEPGWIDRAARAFQFVSGTMSRGDRLGHAWRAGRLTLPGLASDHAMMVKAALALHEATGEPAYLDRAQAWQAALDDRHLAPDGSYFLAADDAQAVVLRLRPSEDDATPNAQAITAQNLIRLAVLTGEDRYREQADRLIAALCPLAAANLYGHATLLSAIDLRLNGAEIVCVGPDNAAFAAAALQLPFLSRIVLCVADANILPLDHPARAAVRTGESAALVCTGQRCSLPVTAPEQLAAAARPTAAALL
ncbi:MAG: thioredoxin domain-containing protein [Methylacidiphilales bacterium]|nr:thioredoxin domain-containing protein [Candidatus Methylacidiphilales bacterium]